MQEPSEGQILIKVRVSGVGPTDLKIRRGDLDGVFPLPEPAVLGFETAGTVDAVGGDVDGVTVGDEVAALLPSFGGYDEYVLAETWTPKPPEVTWNDAAALPASVEAAVGVLRQLQVAEGETLLILGAGGSVGIIATQLAIRNGLTVIGAVGARDEALTRELGATPVRYGNDLLSSVREVADRVDATLDAAGKGGLEAAITLTGGSDRVITLADERAAELGVRFSVATPDRAPDALGIGMDLLASGGLRLRSHQSLPMSAAAEAHQAPRERARSPQAAPHHHRRPPGGREMTTARLNGSVNAAEPPVSLGSRRHRRGFWVVAFAFLMVMALGTVPSPLYGLYRARDHFSLFMVTVAFAVYAVGVVVALLLAGHLSDLYGRRRMLLPAVCISIVSASVFVAWKPSPASSPAG